MAPAWSFWRRAGTTTRNPRATRAGAGQHGHGSSSSGGLAAGDDAGAVGAGSDDATALYRYSWFSAGPIASAELTNSDSSLTDLGKTYVGLPQNCP